MRSVIWFAFSFLILASGAYTAQSDESIREFVHFKSVDVPYEPDSEISELGYVVLSGNPEESGIYVIRLRIPPGLELFAPHYHDQDRFITVISGTWAFGRGDSGTCEDTIPLTAGAYVMHPKGAVHFDGSCSEQTVEVQIIGQGPVDTIWVDEID